MTGKLSKNFHGVGIGPLSNILAVKSSSYLLPKFSIVTLTIVLIRELVL